MAKRKANKKTAEDRERLRALIEEATVDAYGEDEQHMGFMTMIQEEVACPFRAKVIGEDVEVIELEEPGSGRGLNAVVKHKGKTFRVGIDSLEWVEPRPGGFEWIEAFFAWRDGMG